MILKLIIIIVILLILLIVILYKTKLYGNGYAYEYDDTTNKWLIENCRPSTKGKLITNWKPSSNITPIKKDKGIYFKTDLSKSGIGICSNKDAEAKAYFISSVDKLLNELNYNHISSIEYNSYSKTNITLKEHKFIVNSKNIYNDYDTSMGLICSVCNNYDIFIDYEANEDYKNKHFIKSIYTDIVFSSNIINKIFNNKSDLILIISFNEHAYKKTEQEYVYNDVGIQEYIELLKNIINEFNKFKNNNQTLKGVYFIIITYIPKNENEFDLFVHYCDKNNEIVQNNTDIDFSKIYLYEINNIYTAMLPPIINSSSIIKYDYIANKKLWNDIKEIRFESYNTIYEQDSIEKYNQNTDYEYKTYVDNILDNNITGLYYEIPKSLYNSHDGKFTDGFVCINTK